MKSDQQGSNGNLGFCGKPVNPIPGRSSIDFVQTSESAWWPSNVARQRIAISSNRQRIKTQQLSQPNFVESRLIHDAIRNRTNHRIEHFGTIVSFSPNPRLIEAYEFNPKRLESNRCATLEGHEGRFHFLDIVIFVG